MSANQPTETHEAPTRRDTIKGGSALIGGGLLAGCAGESGPSGGANGSNSSGNRNTATNSGESPYSVTIEPAGKITFEDVPETWTTFGGAWAEMAAILGYADGARAIQAYLPPEVYLDAAGLSIDQNLPTFLGDQGIDKELFYELDSDVHLVDPNMLLSLDDSWDRSDVEEISKNIGPVCGNNCRRRREFHTGYPLYTLYEAFKKTALVFKKYDRYEALKQVHDEVMKVVESRIPPKSDRPSIGLLNGGSEPRNNDFSPMNTEGDGYEMKTYRDLGAPSAFTAEQSEGDADYELLLQVDPDVLIVHWAIGRFDSTNEFENQFVQPMQNHPVGGKLTAVREGRVYPGAGGEQGPVTHLFQTELTARQVYPEKFGEFQGIEAQPDIPADERLFDRQRVADIISGDI